MMLKIFYLSIFYFIKYINCETCDDFTVKNANIIYCELVDTDVFNITAVCNTGYQIQPNVFSANVLTAFTEYNVIECAEIGCPVARIPNQIIADQNNIVISKTYCVRTTIVGFCYPNKSYIEFKCKIGYNEFYGPTRIYCLTNNSWDEFPTCGKGQFQLTTEPLDYNDINTTLPVVSTTSTSKVTTSTPNDPVKVCSSNYPVPKNNDENEIIYNLIPVDSSKTYKVDSSVKFKCKPTFYILNEKLSLKTVCRSDGTWSTVADCEKLPCWSDLPQRPLNGERAVSLLFNKFNGSTDGTSVNFTCNSYFKLNGSSRIVCKNGKWNSVAPNCTFLTSNVCLKKPINSFANLVSLEHAVIKIETNYTTYKNVSIYDKARYSCPNNNFLKSNLTLKFNDQNIGYVEAECIGMEKWQNVMCAL